MADTIITNTPERTDDSSVVGWVVALIVVLAVLVAGYVWVRNGANAPASGGAGTNINVQLPTGTGGEGGTTQ